MKRKRIENRQTDGWGREERRGEQSGRSQKGDAEKGWDGGRHARKGLAQAQHSTQGRHALGNARRQEALRQERLSWRAPLERR